MVWKYIILSDNSFGQKISRTPLFPHTSKPITDMWHNRSKKKTRAPHFDQDYHESDNLQISTCTGKLSQDAYRITTYLINQLAVQPARGNTRRPSAECEKIRHFLYMCNIRMMYSGRESPCLHHFALPLKSNHSQIL